MACAEGMLSAESAVSVGAGVSVTPVERYPYVEQRGEKEREEGGGGGQILLTNHNVRLGSGLLDDGNIVERPVDKLGVGILSLHRLGSLLGTHKEGVFVIGVFLLQVVQDVAADVAFP